MTTWYVRPDATHNSSLRNGASYASAWGGWSEITWGGSGVVGGDTLYVCGSHASSSTLSVGAHGASSSVVTISGGYADDLGSITFTGNSFLSFARSYTTLADLTVNADTSNCIFTFGAISSLTIQGCTFNGGTSAPAISFSGGNGSSYTDVTIEGNSFAGGGGSNGSAISWLVAAFNTPLNSITRLSITDNTFAGCSADRAVIHLRIEDSANTSSVMTDIVVTGNTFTDCYAVAMEIYGPGVYGRNSGVRITDNVFRNQIRMGTYGGAISVGGFGPSLTAGFGSNAIARNKGYTLEGPTGLVNTFYGTYAVYHNYGEFLTTHTIDGNGLLFDHGCNHCVAFGNQFYSVTGKDGVSNSGCGIMVLDASNVRAFGNIVDGCRVGLYIGNKADGQSCDIHNNRFTGCTEVGLDVLSTADMAANLTRNNVFTTTDSSKPPVRVASGTFTGESYNCYQGFGSASGHTLAATSITTDPAEEVGTYLGGSDYYGKDMPNPPPLGAVITFTARTQTNRNIAASRLIVDRSIGRRTKAG